MFSNASNFVHGVDNAFLFILGVSLFFLVALTALMIYFVIRYSRKRHPHAVQIKDNTALEITWITIPMILVLIMFYMGWEGFLPMRQAPKDAMRVVAIGKMWKWEFQYPGNKFADTLLLPINKPVKIDLFSPDVLHGFSVPSFRIKEDVVPGKNNYSWFIPGEIGEYDLFCTVYCGVSHSYMHGIIKIVKQEDYDKWIAAIPVRKALPSNNGFKVLEKNGCVACHSIDGSKSVGPTFKGIYGTSVDVTIDGKPQKVTVDDKYIKSSIYDPNKEVVTGYVPGMMKSYKDIIKENEVKEISDYLKTLK
ncbi:MAG: cytochrome c oxidase subunit II [Bacteroidales bacterium]|nr:cytochrome c oxidase subunit II [Bacteroidales bacterium]